MYNYEVKYHGVSFIGDGVYLKRCEDTKGMALIGTNEEHFRPMFDKVCVEGREVFLKEVSGKDGKYGLWQAGDGMFTIVNRKIIAKVTRAKTARFFTTGKLDVIAVTDKHNVLIGFVMPTKVGLDEFRTHPEYRKLAD